MAKKEVIKFKLNLSILSIKDYVVSAFLEGTTQILLGFNLQVENLTL